MIEDDKKVRGRRAMILSDGSPSISITAGKSLFFSPRTRSETRNGSRNIDDSPSYNGVTYKNSSWECSITTKLGFLNRLCSGTKHNYGMHHIRANRLNNGSNNKVMDSLSYASESWILILLRLETTGMGRQVSHNSSDGSFRITVASTRNTGY